MAEIMKAFAFLRFFVGGVSEHEEQSPTASGGAPQMLASAYKGAFGLCGFLLNHFTLSQI